MSRTGWEWMTVVAVLCTACKGDKSSGEGGGDERDARLISDVYTWLCDDGTEYQGVFQQEISLAYAPDGLEDLEPPSVGGCQLDQDMFPSSAGALGADLPDFEGQPRWSSDVDSGELQEQASGFWRDDVSGNTHSCQDITELLGSGIELTDAGALTGVVSPAPPEVPLVEFEGQTYHPKTGAETTEWGDEIVVSWEEHGWEQVWVQIRREREGEAWESVTCNVSDDLEFTLESSIWDLMDESLEVEHNNIYVAFTMGKEEVTETGLKVESVTRAVAVSVVQD